MVALGAAPEWWPPEPTGCEEGAPSVDDGNESAVASGAQEAAHCCGRPQEGNGLTQRAEGAQVAPHGCAGAAAQTEEGGCLRDCTGAAAQGQESCGGRGGCSDSQGCASPAPAPPDAPDVRGEPPLRGAKEDEPAPPDARGEPLARGAKEDEPIPHYPMDYYSREGGEWSSSYHKAPARRKAAVASAPAGS